MYKTSYMYAKFFLQLPGFQRGLLLELDNLKKLGKNFLDTNSNQEHRL